MADHFIDDNSVAVFIDDNLVILWIDDNSIYLGDPPGGGGGRRYKHIAVNMCLAFLLIMLV